MPLAAFFVLVPTSVPGPETVNVTAFVAVVMVLLLLSVTVEVISDVDVPLAVMLVGFAVFRILEAELPVVVTLTVLWAREEAVEVTTAVPAVELDLNLIVVTPADVPMGLVPRSVPSPVTVNVTL